jgi:hypothetical protein
MRWRGLWIKRPNDKEWLLQMIAEAVVPKRRLTQKAFAGIRRIVK